MMLFHLMYSGGDVATFVAGEPGPGTFLDFLNWLLTLAGLSAAASTVTALVITGWQWLTRHDLTDRQKVIVAVAAPFSLVGLADLCLWAIYGQPWTVDGVYQHVRLAVLVILGGQMAFQAYTKTALRALVDGLLARARAAIAG